MPYLYVQVHIVMFVINLVKHVEKPGSVTITIESSTNRATTLSRMNLAGYVGHATMFS